MRLRDMLEATVAVAALVLGLGGSAGAQAPAAATPPAANPAAANPDTTASPAAPGPATPGPATPAPPGTAVTAGSMAAHRASYRLTLDRNRQNSEVTQAQGAMLFEVRDACDGWITRQRLTISIVDRAGDVVETASDYSTWESKDGQHLRFTLTQTAQGAVTQRVAGEAELDGDKGGTVRYQEPSTEQVMLPPGTILPMAHTIRTLSLAQSGQRMLVTPLFDGTTPEGAQDSTTLLSSWSAPLPNVRFPLLERQDSARMRIAFFDRDATAGAGTPEYEVGLRYFANGIADEMKMDFGNFVLDGKMESLEALPHDCG